MKRDMDLVRKILMVCADHDHGCAPHDLAIEDYSGEQIGYHVYLMMQARLVKGVDISGGGDESPQAELASVTWDGHEFLEASRDEGIWSKAKQASGLTGGMVLDVLKSVLIGLATETAKKAAGLS
jgi:hypothetical protein